MKRLFLIICICFIFLGCEAPEQENIIGQYGYKQDIYICTTVAIEAGYKTKVVLWTEEISGLEMAQVMILINNDWQYIRFDAFSGYIIKSDCFMNVPFESEKDAFLWITKNITDTFYNKP